jgi:hypothetical protein
MSQWVSGGAVCNDIEQMAQAFRVEAAPGYLAEPD